MRILVTNDDGIESIGLHKLARALVPLGDVVIGAPDREFSGAGAAVGALHLIRPEMVRHHIEGIEEAWALNGPPALCALFARLGAFGDPFDLVVSGINPGANVGRSVYHSGTIGAAITARNGGISGIAISQDVPGGGIEGQAWDEMVLNMKWDTAASVAHTVVEAHLASPPDHPVALNVNVPDCELAQVKGWRRTELALMPMRSFVQAERKAKPGYEDTFVLDYEYGDRIELPGHTDAGAVAAGYVSLTWLSRILPSLDEDDAPIGSAIDELLGRPTGT
ncbi:MAG: 5'/3'-nucleotidase SurE [Ilumatobacteraceae bacterium]